MEQPLYESVITLQTDIYPLEAIYLACYSFIEHVYFQINPVDAPGEKVKVVEVAMKRKEGGGAAADAGRR